MAGMRLTTLAPVHADCFAYFSPAVAVFSTRTNRLEVDLDAIEQKQAEVVQLREEAGNNVFKRFGVQLKRRKAFLATPPILWLFIVILGVFSALCLYVRVRVCVCVHALSFVRVSVSAHANCSRMCLTCGERRGRHGRVADVIAVTRL